MRSLRVKRYAVGPALVVRPSRRDKRIIAVSFDGDREANISLAEVVAAYASIEATKWKLAFKIETRRHDYFKWLPKADLSLFRRVAAFGSFRCEECERWGSCKKCEICGNPCTPIRLWTDSRASLSRVSINIRDGYVVYRGTTLTPWEVMRMYRDSLWRLYADILSLNSHNEYYVGFLIPFEVRC